jgi:hypothetical protein
LIGEHQVKKIMPLALAAALFSYASAAQAVVISSEAGDLVAYDETYSSSLLNYIPGLAVEITPHAAWQQVPVAPLDPARWISYKNTGVADNPELAPFQAGCSAATPGSCQPLMLVGELLPGQGILNLTAWADDTLGIDVLDLTTFTFTPLVAPNFTQNVCADGAPGCEPLESVTISQAITGDFVALVISVYQVGQDTDPLNNPFGVLYTGTFEQVPEPATLTILASGLFGLGFAARRRRRSKAA